MTPQQIKVIEQGLEATMVLERLHRSAEAMHTGLLPVGNYPCQITRADLTKGLYAAQALRDLLSEVQTSA
jgi:hypothetical protein